MSVLGKRFDDADQVVEARDLREEIIELGDFAIGRITYAPGWRWSTHVKPIVGTEWCQVRHVGLVLSGRFHVEHMDGTSFELTGLGAIDIAPGHDGWVVGDQPTVTIEWTGLREWLIPAGGQRVLATLLITDIVESTERVHELGDRGWRALLSAHDETVRDLLGAWHGQEVSTTGDGFVATFDGPARALRAALAIRAHVRDLGLELRQGIHVGEIERVGDEISGIAVHEAARIAAAAQPGEILASAVTRALAAGSGLAFDERGARELKGLPGTYELFAVADTQL